MIDKIIDKYSKENNIKVENIRNKDIQLWKDWYKTKNSFHKRNIKQSNGVVKSREVKGLGLAKKSCEDITKLIMSEEPQIYTNNNEVTRKLMSVLYSPKNDFFNNLSVLIEKGLALGTVMTTEYLIDGEIIIDYVTAENILPYKHINGYIYGVLTVVKEKINDVDYYYITDHHYDKGVYIKKIKIYKVIKDVITEAEDEKYEGIEREEVIQTEYPRFQIYKNRISNNINDGPMGISIYANSIDKLKGIDNKYDSLDREFILGKKRITVSHSATKTTNDYVDGELRTVQYLDVEDEAWVVIPGLEDTPLKEIEMNLRVTEHIDAINKEISLYSSHIGLGDNYYSFSGQGLKTATEVISNKSEAYKTKTTIQNALYDFIHNIAGSIIEMLGYEANKVNIDITFSDAVIEDLTTEKTNARIDVSQGLMSKRRYMKKYLNLTDEEIDEELEEIEKENATNVMFN